eukprot:CAMPEP_0203759508 /NCGR_PEP_ID=MMETSP0098-20131031/12558_1 /ASSEMBLY_ACC=CAM_ASM_000208 /TAXON_ID=96639 /ORGANISM=" , Strain NY0313808BC1" /LENGTH=309 /DNA_ID=CAMNT_0050652517 /DNA_START=598 /DNA_END=1527 /DNA_ORIENTATION=+
MYRGVNAGYTPHPVGQIKVAITTSQSQEWSFQSKTTISVSATVESAIPLFKGSLTTTASQEFAYGEKTTKSVSTTITIEPGADMIPPYARQAYSFNSKMIMFKIPFKATATIQSDCGTQRSEEIIGTTELSGVASFGLGEYEKQVGPAVPLECKSPFDLTIEQQLSATFCNAGEQCSTNALCQRYGFTGTCCKANDLKPCCAVAGAHAKCIQAGYKAADEICPSPKGAFNPCCSDGPKQKSSAKMMLLGSSKGNATAITGNFTFSGSVEQRLNLKNFALLAKAKPQPICATKLLSKNSVTVMPIGCKQA